MIKNYIDYIVDCVNSSAGLTNIESPAPGSPQILKKLQTIKEKDVTSKNSIVKEGIEKIHNKNVVGIDATSKEAITSGTTGIFNKSGLRIHKPYKNYGSFNKSHLNLVGSDAVQNVEVPSHSADIDTDETCVSTWYQYTDNDDLLPKYKDGNNVDETRKSMKTLNNINTLKSLSTLKHPADPIKNIHKPSNKILAGEED